MCVDSWAQTSNTLVPSGGSQELSPVVLPLLLVALLGLFFALMLAFVPTTGRRSLAAPSTVVGVCGVCSAVSVPVMDTLAWSGKLHWDLGVAVSVLGYVVLLVGISSVPYLRAEDTR